MAEIKHSIVSWDCSFRNFYHLIDGLLSQKYDREKFELIYVEQRDKAHAEAYNRTLGLKTLHDRLLELSGELQLRIEYLNDPLNLPYHLGRCVNRGLAMARGEIISVMDGDLLLPSDFLTRLEEQHSKGQQVVNLLRLMAASPVNAGSDRWTEGQVDFDLCLRECPPVPKPFPVSVDNKGPMISARREAWLAVDGYDEHPIWSTGLSRLGQDVNRRLELACKCNSIALPDRFAVHPYHPLGFSRSTLDSVRLLSLQANLIDWSKERDELSWRVRSRVTQKLFERNLPLMQRMHHPTAGSKRGALAGTFGSSMLLGRAYSGARKIARSFPVRWRLLANI
jgi:hypothetical protein